MCGMRMKGMLIPLMLFAVAFVACNDIDQNKTTTKPYQQPETLLCNLDIRNTAYKPQVSAYSVSYIDVDINKVESALFSSPISGNIYQEVGDGYTSENGNTSETAYIYNRVIRGGFSYTRRDNNSMNWSTVVTPLPGHWNDEFFTKKDLAFMNIDDAVSDVKNTLSQCITPDIEIDDVYALDDESIRAYVKSNRPDDDASPFDAQGGKEAYLFQFRQVVDGIPITNRVWSANARSKPATEAVIAIIYTQSGIEDANIYSLYDVGDEITQAEIIAPEDAMGIYIDEYTKSPHDAVTEITNFELNYMAKYAGEDMLITPAWFLSAKHNAQNGITYEYIVIDAYSGEIKTTAEE